MQNRKIQIAALVAVAALVIGLSLPHARKETKPQAQPLPKPIAEAAPAPKEIKPAPPAPKMGGASWISSRMIGVWRTYDDEEYTITDRFTIKHKDGSTETLSYTPHNIMDKNAALLEVEDHNSRRQKVSKRVTFNSNGELVMRGKAFYYVSAVELSSSESESLKLSWREAARAGAKGLVEGENHTGFLDNSVHLLGERLKELQDDFGIDPKEMPARSLLSIEKEKAVVQERKKGGGASSGQK